MMKDVLVERLALMDQSIEAQRKVAEKALADLHALYGARQELAYVIGLSQQEAAHNAAVTQDINLVNDLNADAPGEVA